MVPDTFIDTFDLLAGPVRIPFAYGQGAVAGRACPRDVPAQSSGTSRGIKIVLSTFFVSLTQAKTGLYVLDAVLAPSNLLQKEEDPVAIARISATELEQLLSSRDLFACIDVRERGEFVAVQIAGTNPVSRGTIEYRVPVMIPDTEIPVVVCCDDGRRSALSADTLARMGYSDVKILEGGLNRWRDEGFPLRSGWGVPGKIYGERVAHEAGVPHITAGELERRFESGETLVVVDVRTREEYLRGHVPHTYHIPGGNLLLDVARLPIDNDTTLVISCAGRTRGILGAQMLRTSAFNKVYALENGAMGWRLAGYELEKGPGREVAAAVDEATAARMARATRELAERRHVRRGPIKAFRHLYESNKAHYLLDVRLPEEFAAGHAARAIPLPLGQVALAHENFLAVRRAPIFVIAGDELRPVWAAALLQDLGFDDVTVLDGGLETWSAVGLPLEQGSAKPFVFGLDAARENVDFIDADAAAAGGATLVDVRSVGEYGFAHIPGSTWLPRGRLELDIEVRFPDKEQSIVTLCEDGTRSILAGETLRTLGYKYVRVLEGGLRKYQSLGRPIEDGLEGTGVSAEQAQADFGHTVWEGALGKSLEDMQRYLSLEIQLVQDSDGQ